MLANITVPHKQELQQVVVWFAGLAASSLPPAIRHHAHLITRIAVAMRYIGVGRHFGHSEGEEGEGKEDWPRGCPTERSAGRLIECLYSPPALVLKTLKPLEGCVSCCHQSAMSHADRDSANFPTVLTLPLD